MGLGGRALSSWLAWFPSSSGRHLGTADYGRGRGERVSKTDSGTVLVLTGVWLVSLSIFLVGVLASQGNGAFLYKVHGVLGCCEQGGLDHGIGPC